MAVVKVDEHKILLAIICENQEEGKQQADFFSKLKIQLPVFDKFKIEVAMVQKDKNLAKTLNTVQKNNDAKFKIFITNPLVILNQTVVSKIIEAFFMYPNVGMIGLFGSEIPLNGDYRQAKSFYGSYLFKDTDAALKAHRGKMPLMFQNVHMVDSSFFATSQKISFDEKAGKNFLMAAQGCRYRQEGWEVGVLYFDEGMIAFSKDACIYSSAVDAENYAKQLQNFVNDYKDIINPLVSICIPTYNQPRFVEFALQSALAQTYKNIEIIIGDDSTNEDTKNMIQPYLKKNKNLKYFYHGGPLGKKGGNNIRFVLNKSAGKYINLLFHDDYIFPEKISRMMEYFTRDLENKITLTVSARVLIDDKNQILGQMNPCKPTEDLILSGRDVGRKILFSKINFLGEVSTSLIKRENILAQDPETGENKIAIGVFCGVQDKVYGDFGTWLNLLKDGGECVFIKETLSAFRRHPQQNTYDMSMKTRLFLEFMGYLTVSWLNNLYFNNYDEYKYCVRHWKIFYDTYCPRIPESEAAEDINANRKILDKMSQLIIEEKYPEVLDYSINYLLSVLDEKNSITPLIKKNEKTGLYEKAFDIIPLCGEQR